MFKQIVRLTQTNCHSSRYKEINIALLGAERVGKTSYMQRQVKACTYTPSYIPTNGLAIHPIHVQSSHGMIKINMWEWGGNPKFHELYEHKLLGMDGVMIMSDNTRESNRIALEKWVKIWSIMPPYTPCILVRNKCELETDSNMPLTHHTIHISVRNNFNLVDPLIYFIKHLV